LATAVGFHAAGEFQEIAKPSRNRLLARFSLSFHVAEETLRPDLNVCNRDSGHKIGAADTVSALWMGRGGWRSYDVFD
jgi:hypothetical protein